MGAKAILYFYSRSGNTRRIAEHVAGILECDAEELRDSTDYSGAIGFMKGGLDALRRAEGKIAPPAHDPAGYEWVIIGQPVWAGRPVPALNAFLRRHDLKGRKVALFVTYDGNFDRQCLEVTQVMLKAAEVVSTLSLLRVGRNPQENLEKAEQWAKGLKEKMG